MPQPRAKSPKTTPAPSAIIILAAGQGKRMHSDLPKVLHEMGGQPLLFHILDSVAKAAPDSPVAIVVGHGRELLEMRLKSYPNWGRANWTTIHQAQQLGTGHAVRCAMESDWGKSCVASGAQVVVLPGDQPLMSPELIEAMCAPLGRSEPMRMLTVEQADPTGYGRVLRKGAHGPVVRIVEHRDATPKQRLIREIAISIFAYRPDFLTQSLRGLTNKNAQKEFYLTDLVEMARRKKKSVGVISWPDAQEVLGINDLWELSQVSHLLNQRTLKAAARAGVIFENPITTSVEVSVSLSPGVRIGSGCHLSGATRIGTKTTLGPNCILKDVVLGEGCFIKAGTVAEDSRVHSGAQVGPYAHLRPGSEVGESAKIGNFVEIKKSQIGAHTSIAHLSYVGDARIGSRVNIGCGFVTCNFDGRVIDGERKHRTTIEDDVFVGSDCQVVAPITIKRGAYIASGSTITEEVESESLAIARSRQTNKPGYARKLKG